MRTPLRHPAALAAALAAAALLGAAAPGHAQSFSLNFDGAGATAQAFAPVTLTIGYGTFVPDRDQFGDPIAGTEHWEIDPTASAVPVNDPIAAGFGAAPSPAKALDATGGTVLLVFDQPFNLTSFRATLDNSASRGNFTDPDIKFYGADFGLLGTIATDHTAPGFVAATSGPLAGVTTILLPGGAYYDNITAVPEPSTWAIGLGILALLAHRLRRRRAGGNVD